MIKTRFCMISDTHDAVPFPPSDTKHAYRRPLPSADVLLHAGDLTGIGTLEEYEQTLSVIKAADAGLKIVIAGNHDLSLDAEYQAKVRKGRRDYRGEAESVEEAKAIWTNEEAKAAGIVYLEEGISKFELKNGAKFTIYTSPYTPEFYGWAFAYERHEDRYSPSKAVSQFKATTPIPSFPAIDILLTHGPPYGILDETSHGDNAGCENLLAAVGRCRPRVHCFGHIHEGYGAERYQWARKSAEPVLISQEKALTERASFVDIAAGGPRPLKFGEETLFVNAAIMDVQYNPANAPWVVDLDLPAA
ncbi:hypothetical protein MMC19_002061 [Ptychographa xylographoides]|nr:hypothetical protein [Ptychographa xylographoides]